MAQESKTMALAEGRLDMYSGEDGLIVPLIVYRRKGCYFRNCQMLHHSRHIDIATKFAERQD